MSNIRILKRKEVEMIVGLGRSSIYAKVKDGSFPKPVKLSSRSVGWIQSEVQSWLENKIAESRNSE